MSSHYLRALEEFYQVKAEPVNFGGENCSRAFELVNDWLRRQTGGRVFRILNRAPSCDSKLLMVGSVDMSANLLNQFDSANTFQKGLFFLPGNRRYFNLLSLSTKGTL